jgi:hypothetical protein
MFSWLMNLCHDACMARVVVVMGLGSLVCSWDAGSVNVVASVDRASSSLGCGRGLPPECSFACTAVAFSIRSCV